MWVKISKPEDTKKLKVGDKVRVDGVEYKCTSTYSPTDYGFDVDGKSPHGCDTIGSDSVECFEYTIELWEESQMIERDKEYDIKLTGEQMAILLMLTGSTAAFKSKIETYERLQTLFENNPNTYKFKAHWMNALVTYREEASEWLDSVFTLPETEKEKKIREMEEQYTALGKAIEEVKKGSGV